MKRLGVAVTLCFLLGAAVGGVFFPGFVLSESQASFTFLSYAVFVAAVGLFRKHRTVFVLLCCIAFFFFGAERRMLSLSSSGQPLAKKIEAGIDRWASTARGAVKERLGKTVTEEALPIANALLLGDKSGLDKDLKAAFRNAGVSHTLALSGMHVGIIWTLVCFMMSFLKFSHRSRLWATVASIALIFAYAVCTGLSPSVSRACIMLAVWKITELASSGKDRLGPVLIAAMTITMFNPAAVESISFQLSFMAVCGIVFIYPAIGESIDTVLKTRPGAKVHSLRSALTGVLGGGLKLCGISISCQIATFPLILLYFGKISGNFLLSNVAVAPLVTLSVVCSALSASLGWVPHLGNLAASAASLIIELLKDAVMFLGS